MDLSEALKFTPIPYFTGDSLTTIPPSSESITPVHRNNKAGCTYTCTNRNHNVLFHYSSTFHSVKRYDTRSRDIQSQCKASSTSSSVLHMACSDDARILLLVHTDGSVSCMDVTLGEMKLRWCMENVHSHKYKYGVRRQGDDDSVVVVVPGKRFKANVHRGPVHSVKFQRNGYHALIADAIQGLMILDCQAGKVIRRISCEGGGSARITCADWSFSQSGDGGSDSGSGSGSGEIVIGYDDGSIGFVNIENQITKVVPDLIQQENENDDEMNGCWSCTHVDYFEENYIAIGMCRVSLPDGMEDNDCMEQHSSSDLEGDSNDDDDCADHEACLLIYDRNKQTWTELGDVVPFFNIPKFARHVFFTTYLPQQQLLLVACNVSGEIAVVARNNGGNEDEEEEAEWQVCELQEGNAAMAPVTDNDEFLVPTGVNWIVDGDGKVDFVLTSSDGSISVFQLEHCTDENFGSMSQVQYKELEWNSIQDDPVEVEITVEETTQVGDVAVSASQPKFTSVTTPFSETKSTIDAQTSAATLFGGGFGGVGAKNVFGQTSSLGFSSSPFGVNSAMEQSKPASSFRSPAFGLSSARPGEFTLASTAKNNTITQELSPAEKSAPIFGSTLKVTNTFGSISNATQNNFSSVPSVGFASLASRAKEKTDFGTTTDIKSQINNKDLPLPTTGRASGQTIGDVRIVKSFSESESSETSAKVDADTKASDTGSLENFADPDSPDELSPEGQRAARAFDDVDQDKTGRITVENLESLLDAIGEGYHGDEFDKQVAILDPTSSGFIDRRSFISWYCHLGDVSDHDGSLDSDEENEREEERAKAEKAFDSVATDGVLRKSDFEKLMEQMGTTYCEEEHRRTVRKISDSDGNISKEPFVNWYMDWLFGDGDESETSEQLEPDVNDDSSAAISKPETSAKGWGDTFAIDKDSWKCVACMLLNKGSVSKCVACESVRPGHEHDEKNQDQNSKQGNSDGKFIFSAAGNGAEKGFSFGFTPTEEKAKDETRGSGFTFGFSPPVDNSKATSKGGVSFGFEPSQKKDEKDTSLHSDETNQLNVIVGEKKSSIVSSSPPMAMKALTPFGSSATKIDGSGASGDVGADGQKTSIASAFPPMALQTPSPFGSSVTKIDVSAAGGHVEADSKKTSNASAFPPMAMKAPTPFGTSTKKIDVSGASGDVGADSKKTSTASAFPPMAMKAPTPFGSSAATADGVKNASSASGFPPMAMKAPTPFGSSTTNVDGAKKSSSAPDFPPMAMKAPTPFGSPAATANGVKNAVSAPGFPPMAMKAPTPFGSSTANADGVKNASRTPGFPPMAMKAPTPFGSSTTKIDGRASGGAKKSSDAPRFPPMAMRATSPFGSSTTKVDAGSSDNNNNKLELEISRSSSSLFCSSHEYSTEYESHFWALLNDWDNSLKDVNTSSQNLDPKEDLNCDRKGFDLIEEISFNLSTLHEQSHKMKESSLLLLSLRDDLDRQIEESKDIIDVHFEKDSDAHSKMSMWRSLDIESEKKRRRLINRCLSSQKSLARLREKISLLQGIVKKPTTIKNAFLPWTPMRIKRFPTDKVTTKFVLESLKGGYDRTKTLEDKANMLRGNVTTILSESPEDHTMYSLRTSARGKSRVNAISLLSPTSFAKSSPASTMSIISALQSLNKVYIVSAKQFEYGDNIFESELPSVKFPSWRANSTSNVMNVSSSVDSLSLQTQPMANRGVQPKGGQPRAEWYKTDTKGMEETKLELPRTLKMIDATKAEQQALAPFGVTPEKMSSMKATIEKGKLKKVNMDNSVDKYTVSKLGETTVQSKPISMQKEEISSKLSLSVKKKEETKNASSKGSEVSFLTPNLPDLKAGGSSKMLVFPQADSKPSSSGKSEKEPRPTSDSDIFGGMKQIGKSLDLSGQKQTSLNIFSTQLSSDERGNKNYELILTNFYTMHNASKLNEVQKTLEKYKGNEAALFEKLSRKYNVPNPLGTESQRLGAQTHPPQNEMSAVETSPFGITASTKKNEETSTAAQFGITPISSFGASLSTTAKSPFGSSSSSNIGFGNSPATPFGQQSSANSTFGQRSQPLVSPVGQSSSSTLSSFGNSAGAGYHTFGGKTAREILTSFYQQRNPSKISEVDKLIAKYAGNEEQLLRNLAKKYNLDPSYFGLSTESAPVFGTTSLGGQVQPFGQTTQSSGGSAAFGSSGFASLAQSVPGNTGGFGSLSPAQATNSFSALNSSGFGSSATPFGAPRR